MAGHDDRNNAFATLLTAEPIAIPGRTHFNMWRELTLGQFLEAMLCETQRPIDFMVSTVRATRTRAGLHETSLYREPLLVNGSSTSLRSSSRYITRSSIEAPPSRASPSILSVLKSCGTRGMRHALRFREKIRRAKVARR
jgi:hypothetical protein